MRLRHHITLLISAAVIVFAAPAYASSSVLECRETMAELEAVSESINAFNESSVLLRANRKKLFEKTIFRKEQWGHIFQEPAREKVNEKSEKKLEWFYQRVELSFSTSKITKDNKICGRVSSKSFVDVFELKIDPDNEIISATVNTVK